MKYTLLGPFNRKDTSMITTKYPDMYMYSQGENRLEIIGLRSLFLSGVNPIESRSNHSGSQAVTITYVPTKLVAVQRIKPLTGYFLGEIDAMSILEKGMQKLSCGKSLKTKAPKVDISEAELQSFCKKFFPSNMKGYQDHRFDVLRQFEISCEKPDIDKFLEIVSKQ
jgi:hypothetical protein